MKETRTLRVRIWKPKGESRPTMGQSRPSFAFSPTASKRGGSMARLILSLCAAMLGVLLAVPLSGQGLGKLTGVVVDPSGAAIPGIELKLTNQATAEAFETSSDATGHFAFEKLPLGRYLLFVHGPGVEPAEVTVNVGAHLTPALRVRMKVAKLKQEVTVRSGPFSSPSTIDNTDAIAIDQSFLMDLPIRYEKILTFPSLFTDDAASATGEGKLQILVDGVPADNLEVPATAIRRISVNKNPYSAEFQRPGKGRIHVDMIHHIHENYHGELLTALQSSSLNARNAFATSVPPEHRNLSEATLQGPITHNIRFLVSGRYDSHDQAQVVNAATLDGPLVENVILPERNTFLVGRLSFMRTAAGNISIAYKYDNLSQRYQGAGGLVLPENSINDFFHQNDVRIVDSKNWRSLINQFRMGVGEWRENFDNVSQSPGLDVLGAFSGGGAQAANRLKNTVADIEDIASWSVGKHTLQFGGGVEPRYESLINPANFGGTFIFSSLSDFAQGNPSLYQVNVGQPQISFNQYKYYAFVQDEYRLRPNLSFSYGLRRQWQSNVSYGGAVAPRVALAYAPGRRNTMLRAGFGVFYGTQPASMEADNLLYNGVRIREVDVTNPSYPTPFPAGEIPPEATPSVLRIAPNIRFPYLVQASASVERQLGKKENFLTIGYTMLRGVGLYRERNLNAPLPGTITPPDPSFINFDQYESSATSRSNTLEVTFRSRALSRLNILAQYRLAKAMNDTGGFRTFPANSYDLRPEWGRADYDRRHRFTFAGSYSAFWNLRVGAILSVSSGMPYDITTGFDNNNDTLFTDRPPGVTRNTGNEAAFANLDLRFSKSFRFSEEQSDQRRLEVGVDAFNALNHANFLNYIGIVTSPFFGTPDKAEAGRELQISVKFKF
jgi:Carboxypeptidase regulatory-like domain